MKYELDRFCEIHHINSEAWSSSLYKYEGLAFQIMLQLLTHLSDAVYMHEHVTRIHPRIRCVLHEWKSDDLWNTRVHQNSGYVPTCCLLKCILLAKL